MIVHHILVVSSGEIKTGFSSRGNSTPIPIQAYTNYGYGLHTGKCIKHIHVQFERIKITLHLYMYHQFYMYPCNRGWIRLFKKRISIFFLTKKTFMIGYFSLYSKKNLPVNGLL